ncbi:hypothetical protein OG21DRAFT_1526441 [Imleria badia]|nr:hypothetical protein OG21DRAFT_1526441 [Imleria badia]
MFPPEGIREPLADRVAKKKADGLPVSVTTGIYAGTYSGYPTQPTQFHCNMLPPRPLYQEHPQLGHLLMGIVLPNAVPPQELVRKTLIPPHWSGIHTISKSEKECTTYEGAISEAVGQTSFALNEYIEVTYNMETMILKAATLMRSKAVEYAKAWWNTRNVRPPNWS